MTPQIGPKEVVFENQYVKISRVPVQFKDFKKEYYVNEYGQCVGLLIAKGDDIMLVRQYRLLVNAVAWEIPGGRIDEGETPEQAAIREALEETGLRCQRGKPLLFFHPGLDTFHNPTYVYYTDEFEEAPDQAFDPREVTERLWVPLTRCIEMIFRGEILDSLTITALFAFHTLKKYPALGTSLTGQF